MRFLPKGELEMSIRFGATSGPQDLYEAGVMLVALAGALDHAVTERASADPRGRNDRLQHIRNMSILTAKIVASIPGTSEQVDARAVAKSRTDARQTLRRQHKCKAGLEAPQLLKLDQRAVQGFRQLNNRFVRSKQERKSMTDFLRQQRLGQLSGENLELLEATTRIVVACIERNHHATKSLSELIAETFHELGKITSQGLSSEPASTLRPAVPVKASVTPDYIICLEDGKHFKSLKGHLTALGMSPEQYRAKWNLPADYPMVAAKLSAARSAIARESKLGCGLNERRIARAKR
jgi:predicted transcriptional regulator